MLNNKVFGIDISRYQRDIDLADAREEGVKFAIIKCSQSDFTDPMFITHYNNAKARGIYVGAYHYLTATTEAAAKAEAQYVISKCLTGRKFEYPIFADCEDSLLEKLDKATVDKVITAFCGTIESAGYWAGFYCNYNFYVNHCSGAALAKRYSHWHAAWANEPLVDCQMWQFGGETNMVRDRTVGGVVCDQDYCYINYPQLIVQKGLNGYTTADILPSQDDANMPDLTGDKLTVGEVVRMKKNAPIYGKVGRFSDWVYTVNLYVREIKDDRIVVSTQKTGAVTGAVEARYLTKV